ncbi:DNA repair metallo-beta-lactamase-like protein [Elsinoe fawcettii]|nr:DNA repair metallo-beta-lactamase-like protein [Elsinoe fawcettii]
MFRNPRENIARTPGEYVAPSVGRPPSPPLTSATRPLIKQDYAPAPRPMMAAATSVLPTIGRGSTTPRKGANPANNKAKGKPNGSILSFFKKAEDENDELFVRTKDAAKRSESSPWFNKPISEEQDAQTERFQENGAAVKRRKLEHTEGDSVEESLSRDAGRAQEAVASPVEASDTASRPAASTRKSTGLFVEEESDDENAEGEEAEEMSPKPASEVEQTTQAHALESEVAPAAAPEVKEETLPDSAPMPPSLPREQTSMALGGDFADFEDLGDFDEDMFEEGDEFVERRYMEEQARLEAEQMEMEEVDLSDRPMDSLEGEGPAAECSETANAPTCPICSISMAGVSDQDAGVHVNNCLDGNPTPLPTEVPPKPKDEVKLEAPKAADRFRKVPRAPKPGQANPFVLGEKSGGGGGSAFSRLMSGHAEDAAWADAAASERDSRGKPAYQRTCPFYKILPGFNICVDAFRYGAVEGCKAYFLSHFHSDHYIGLTSNWCHGPIYCSKVTANLVKQQLRVDPQYVVALDWETKIEVPGSNGVSVTMISANHCPGSSLYLFEKVIGKGLNPKLQRVLHCGDFRACKMHVEHPLLRSDVIDAVSGKKKDQKLDVCYLDTTYLNPKYAFPSQEQVITACAQMCVSLSRVRTDASDGWETMKRERAGAGMVKFVKRESGEIVIKQEDEEVEDVKPDLDAMSVMKRANEKHRGRLLVVVGTYSIGKERICLGIARALKSKIFAPTGKRRIVRALEDPELNELITDDPTEAQVHMTPLFEIRADTLDDYLKDYKDHFSRAVGFRPSGWNYRPPNSRFTDSPNVSTVLHSDNWKSTFSMKDLVPQRGSTSRASCFGVPYSEHSSFRELTMFCCALRIEKIIPTVNIGSAKSREKMKGWCEKWAMERKKNGLFKLKEGEECNSFLPNFIMFLLRRAAARGLQSKSLAFQSSRSFISSSSPVTRSQFLVQQRWSQRRLYSEEADKAKSNESPAEREAGETVTSEPPVEEQKQQITEESIATPDVADGAQSSEPTSTSADANPLGMEPGDAAPEPESVTPTPASSATESASSTVETIKEKASDTLESASQAVSRTRSAATGAARGERVNRDRADPSKILYVGNLFFDLTPEKLKAAFEPFGNVVNCKIVTDSSGLSKGFGYVEFDDVNDATTAIKELDQTELEGRRMAVQYHVRRMRTQARPASASHPPSKVLFIGNMSFQMSDKDLNDLFRSVQNVLDVRVAIDRRSGQPRGFAHADFTDTASAEKAKKILENKVVYGRQLRVDFGLPSSQQRQR